MIEYGTAGFRAKAESLDKIVYRVGILAVLRSKKKGCQATGVMITASHNPECDNGVKVIDPHGEMLEHSWEKLATQLANTNDDQLEASIQKIAEDEDIDLSQPSIVFIGQDTRSSSPRLAERAIAGIRSQHSSFKDFGVVTTPMLHYFVNCYNTEQQESINEDYYNQKLCDSFLRLNKCALSNSSSNYQPVLVFDGANGVGALQIKKLLPRLSELLTINIYNDGKGVLNHLCGADYVKVQQKAPEGVPVRAGARCVSVDGDSDRLIYYYIDEKDEFHMLDGDRIATLIAGYLMELIMLSKLQLNLGLVQTAYANGSSTDYITNTLKVPVACVPTGVKHLHHRATQFDVGVYFEANGHGTVVYSKTAEEKIKEAVTSNFLPEDERQAARRLRSMMALTNQTVGDALSDILLVETVLHARGWSLADWEKNYRDLPNRQLKVTIKDRNVIKTKDAERQCESPRGLQEEIDRLVLLYPRGRCFVRASGTEDVVRVYAEASTQQEADKLAAQVSLAVYQLAGGIGNAPGLPS